MAKIKSINGKYNIGIILFSIIKVQNKPVIPTQLIKPEIILTYLKQQINPVMAMTAKLTKNDSVITPKLAIKEICAPKIKAFSKP